MKYFFETLGKNIVHSFTGKNVLFHILAIILTYVILMSGFDWYYFGLVRDPLLNQLALPALIGGALFPIIVPIILIMIARIRKNKNISILGWCLGQAAFIGWLVSSTYKAFTGRVQPNLIDLANDSSHSFNFGFLEHGIFWGWPSSHTTVAFAMAFALIFLYRKNITVRNFALLYAFYVGIGISFSIHWFSEFIAGALIGSVIGMTVGKSFSKRV